MRLLKRKTPSALVGFAEGRSANFLVNGVRFAVLRDGGELSVCLAHEVDASLPAKGEREIEQMADALRSLKAAKEAYEKFMRGDK
jgi:hypothetical protein